MERLTDQSYWNDKYGDSEHENLLVDGYKNYNTATIYKSIQKLGLDGKSILEIGAGGSQWLVFLAQQHPTSRFTGLDYAVAGCDELEARAKVANVEIEVIAADLFNPPENLIGHYDLVISFGVVEHFDSLSKVMGALAKYTKPTGSIWTIIPNMSGILGLATKCLNQGIYDIHNPHDLKSFKQGHNDAQLEIVESSYLCATEFGVLSSTITNDSSWLHRTAYKWLYRLSMLIKLFEVKVTKLPAVKSLSPYIVCVSNTKKLDR